MNNRFLKYTFTIRILKTIALISSPLLVFVSCTEDPGVNQFSFYHWKSSVNFNVEIKEALDMLETEKIYLHYFDVDNIGTGAPNENEIYPTYVIKNVAREYKDFDIIPVVFIKNRVLRDDSLKINELSKKIVALINQISLKHFQKKHETIQIDCDWTQSTREVYFSLLRLLKKEFEIDVTIRLHQIKFKESTGIPPVGKGTLMLYNVGKLDNFNQNSILENEIVKQYINEDSSYPIPLKMALPLFSQTVIKNKFDEIKLINHSVRSTIEGDIHFNQINQNTYEVIADTLFYGFYLSQGCSLKIEEICEKKIIQSYRTVRKSNIKIDEVIFYHLDECILSSIDLNEIINEL